MRRVFLGATAAIALGWLASFVAVVVASRRDLAAPADAIVVLGAAQYGGRPSPVLRARLSHAASLWRQRLAPRVLITGGTAAGDSVSEAVVAREYLLGLGVPDTAVAAVPEGRTSEQSIRAAARLLAPLGRRVILVSDGFHMLRLAVLARRMGLEPLGSPATDSPIGRSSRGELAYLLAESVKVPVAFLVTPPP